MCGRQPWCRTQHTLAFWESPVPRTEKEAGVLWVEAAVSSPRAHLQSCVPLCLKQKDGFSPLEEKPGLML